MPRAKCLFRGTDVVRACVAAEKANKKVARVEINKAGKIILVLDNGASDTARRIHDGPRHD